MSVENQFKLRGARDTPDIYGIGGGGQPGTGTEVAAPGAAAPAGDIEVPAQQRARAVYDGMIKRGADHATAAAWAANALHESSANPSTGPGDRGASQGLFMWNGPRLQAYIAKYGHSPQGAPLDEQLDFVQHELETTEAPARAYLDRASPAEKAAVISREFLRPRDREGEQQRRSATAQQLATLWQPQQATATPGGGGVVARNPGAVNVAGPGAPTARPVPAPVTIEPETGVPVVASPGAPPVAVAPVAAPGTPGATGVPPAPVAATLPPELQTDANHLTSRDKQQLAPILNRVRSGQVPYETYQNEVQQRQAFNVARQEKWQTQQIQAQEKAQSQSNEATRIQLQQEGLVIQRENAAQQRRFQGAPTGHQWNDKGVLVRSPGFEGAEADERVAYRLEHGDPSSPQYATDYTAMKWKMTPSGSYIENDMSQYRPPTRGIQRPTYVPQPTGTMLEKVREADTDARVIVPAIDRYVDIFKETGGQSWNAYFDNTADPKSQRLLGAFDALRTVLRSPTYYNTGVLQPAEMALLKQDLVSPQSIRGLWATPQALEARLHEIKLTVLRRQDAELRSVGKEGVIVRDKAELDRLQPGTVFYDEDGNRRIKPRTE
jgi:hypothetical protein